VTKGDAQEVKVMATTPKDSMAGERTRKRVYFFWDYDLTEEDVREILAGDDVHRRAWVISRILNAARWDDIWKYITVDDIRAHFDLLRFRLPYLRELWTHALEVWSRDDRANMIKESKPAYNPEPAPQLQPGILTPLQHAFLTRFFDYDIGEQFFLTGGTALAAFYLYHRLSEDIDLFTLEDGALDAAQDALLTIGGDLGCDANVRRLSPHFLRTVLTPPVGESLKIDLVQDVGSQFGQKQWCEGISVDALVNIAANKVTAILGRADAKDFVDLYFLIHQLGYDLDELIQMAKHKDLGLTEFYLAGMMRQIHKVKDLPVMLKPVDLETLTPFYDELADRLLAQNGPSS
jgi:hypothetical protein